MARLLIDTHVLIWVPAGDPRVSVRVRNALQNGAAELFVSAVTAFELTDLQKKGRIAMTEGVGTIAGPMGFSVIDFPSQAWRELNALPDIHRDPVDRMLIAHAITGGFTIVTADKGIRSYSVETLW